MYLLDRYILRLLLQSTIASTLVITGLIWLVQALRHFEIITARGQTLLTFFNITLLSIPLLIQILQPVGIMIGTIFTFNRLNSDHELAVIHAAGIGSRAAWKPLIIFAAIMLSIQYFLSLYLVPHALRTTRFEITQVRADVLANIFKPGQFLNIDEKIIINIAERGARGQLSKLYIEDFRDQNETLTYLAKEGILKKDEVTNNAFLVLLDGSILRLNHITQERSEIQFREYAFDLSAFTKKTAKTFYTPQEVPTLDLMKGQLVDARDDIKPKHYIAELNDRFSGPLYCLVFMLVPFAFIGKPSSSRSGNFVMIFLSVILCIGVRASGLIIKFAAEKSAIYGALAYVLPLAIGLFALLIVFNIIKLNAAQDRLERLTDQIFSFFANILKHSNKRFGGS